MTLQEFSQLTGLSYAEIASRIPPYTRGHISQVANGMARPSFELAIEIEKVTGNNVLRTEWYPPPKANIKVVPIERIK